MSVPVVAVVLARPDVELDVRTVRSQLPGELVEAGVPERILVAGVDPDRDVEVGARCVSGLLEDVVALEVRGVVERTRRGLASRVPDRRRVRPDRTEQAGIEADDVE